MVFTTDEQAQLRRVFEAVVSDMAPAPDLEWLTDSGLVARAEPRTAKVRRPGFVIAATIGVVALVTGLVLALTRGGERLAGDVGGGDGSFPYLLIDAGQLDENLALVSAFDQESSVDSPDRLHAFGLPEASLTSARIWFVSVPTGSDFFRGGEFEEPGWDPIPIEKGRAFIRTGPVGSSVMWETDDPGGEVLFAHAFMVEPAVLIDVISGLEKDDSGWGPRFLPEGFIELYDGPARADVERLIAQSWIDLDEADGSAIELYLIDRGPGGGEQALNELLGFTVSELEIGATEVRGKPALVYAIGNETIYQWMETATVTVRVVIRGLIDPESVLGALVLVDQPTWDAAINDAIGDRGVGPSSTVAPSTTDS